jgi:hypothetical protein
MFVKFNTNWLTDEDEAKGLQIEDGWEPFIQYY